MLVDVSSAMATVCEPYELPSVSFLTGWRPERCILEPRMVLSILHGTSLSAGM